MKKPTSYQPATSLKILGFSLFSAFAATTLASQAASESITLKLGGKTLAHNKSLVVTNANKQINPSLLYSYEISGSVRGKNGDLGALFPKEIPIKKFLNGIKSGSSSILSGSLPSDGNLPATVLSQTFKGAKNFKGVGRVSVKLLLSLTISESGQVKFSVTKVRAKIGKKKASGLLRLGKGSQVEISSAPVVQFKRISQNIEEGTGSIILVVTKFGNQKAPAIVNYSFQDNTAIAGTDYTAIEGTVSFAANETVKTIEVPILDDEQAEKFERFQVILSSADAGSVLGANTEMTIGIFDND